MPLRWREYFYLSTAMWSCLDWYVCYPYQKSAKAASSSLTKGTKINNSETSYLGPSCGLRAKNYGLHRDYRKSQEEPFADGQEKVMHRDHGWA